MAVSINGTTLTFNDATTMTTAATGTVSSIATGNGLSGGTITTSGTLTLGSVGFNTVGSYCYGNVRQLVNQTQTYTGGNTYSAGSGSQQLCTTNTASGSRTNNLSGTWRYMNGTVTINTNGDCEQFIGLTFVRVS